MTSQAPAVSVPLNWTATSSLANIFIVFSALIYLPFLGHDIETQPVIAMGMSVIALMALLTSSTVTKHLNKFVLGLFLFLGLVLYHSLFIGISVEWPYFLRMVLGPFYLVGAVVFARHANVNAIRFLALFFTSTAVLELISPELYSSVSSVISTARFESLGFGLRGLKFMTPEPIYAVISLTFMILATGFLYKLGRLTRGQFRFYIPLAIGLLLLTLSSYAAVMLLLMIGLYVLYAGNWRASVGVALISVLLFAMMLQTETRAAQLFVNLMNIDFDDLVRTFIVAEGSFSTRILKFLASLYGFYSYPAGYGLGSFSGYYWQHFDAMGWNWVVLHGFIGPKYLSRDVLDPSSMFPTLLHDLGIFGLLIVGVIVWTFRKGVVSGYLAALLFFAAMFMLTVSAQMTNPVPWVLLGMLSIVLQKRQGDAQSSGGKPSP